MLTIKKTNAYIGLLLVVIAITISPIIKVPIKGNWILYQTDNRLFFISLILVALTGFCLYLRRVAAFRFFTYVLFIWSVLMAAAVYFKSNNYFGSKFFDKALAKTIHYQWGWIVLLVGVLLLLSSVKRIQFDAKINS